MDHPNELAQWTFSGIVPLIIMSLFASFVATIAKWLSK
jgi:hypothetical protein